MTKFKMNGFSRYTKEDLYYDEFYDTFEHDYCEETQTVTKKRKSKKNHGWDDHEELYEEENAWLDEWLD